MRNVKMDKIYDYTKAVFTYHNDIIFFKGDIRRQINKNKKDCKIYNYKEFRFDRDFQTKKIIREMVTQNLIDKIKQK